MRERVSAMWLIQFFIGVFLTASALIFLSGGAGSEVARGISKVFGSSSTVGLIVAILELVSGVVLLVSLFLGAKPRWLFLALLVIFIFWTINVVAVYLLDGFAKPNLMAWLRDISLQLIVLSGLWGVMMQSR
ncbi:MAG: hypothetical protein FWD87_10360 [Spirochaetaceae bacterium]|nr:hypothetical protein [Spirochaetaceae bacterium]